MQDLLSESFFAAGVSILTADNVPKVCSYYVKLNVFKIRGTIENFVGRK